VRYGSAEVAARLRDGRSAGVSIALQMMLSLEGVECKPI
jgi:hypothetical protein